MNEIELKFRGFLRSVFCEPNNRRKLLALWLSLRKPSSGRLCEVFEEIIGTILHGSLNFTMLVDRFLLFGAKFPIRYEWLQPASRQFLLLAFANRAILFREHKEYENNLFDYSHFTLNEARFFPVVWRRQLVRDFVHLVLLHSGGDYFTLQLIVCLQGLLLEHKCDKFIATLHETLQGRTGSRDVMEVPCLFHGEKEVQVVPQIEAPPEAGDELDIVVDQIVENNRKNRWKKIKTQDGC